jgi:hypothetical protein
MDGASFPFTIQMPLVTSVHGLSREAGACRRQILAEFGSISAKGLKCGLVSQHVSYVSEVEGDGDSRQRRPRPHEED